MTPPLRVAMPMLTLVPGGMGGTETYARELLRCLDARDDVDVRVYVPENATGFSPAPGEETVPGLRTAESTRARLAAAARAAASRSTRHQVRRGADLVHHPFTVPVPGPGRLPHVITLHDVQHLEQPEHFPAAERAWRLLTYDRASRRAHRVVTDSEHARTRAISSLGLDPESVIAAPLGCAQDFVPWDGPREDFVLYPARRWPHKNHGRLLEAMALARRERPGLRLVLTGGGAPVPDAPEWVEQRGLVPRAELLELYRSAGCLVFPSLYEGFGLPPLEAMASGCPVATSNAASLPEVEGDAGVVFDPLDVPAMSRAVLTALDSRERLAPLGLVRVRQFTWERCADLHVTAFREAVEQVSRRQQPAPR